MSGGLKGGIPETELNPSLHAIRGKGHILSMHSKLFSSKISNFLSQNTFLVIFLDIAEKQENRTLLHIYSNIGQTMALLAQKMIGL